MKEKLLDDERCQNIFSNHAVGRQWIEPEAKNLRDLNSTSQLAQ